MSEASFLLSILEALPDKLTDRQKQQCSKLMSIWDLILRREKQPDVHVMMLPSVYSSKNPDDLLDSEMTKVSGLMQNGPGTSPFEKSRAHVTTIRVAISLYKPTVEGSGGTLDVKFMQRVFIHELAHVNTERSRILYQNHGLRMYADNEKKLLKWLDDGEKSYSAHGPSWTREFKRLLDKYNKGLTYKQIGDPRPGDSPSWGAEFYESEAEGNEGLSYLLGGRSKINQIGEEIGQIKPDGISVLRAKEYRKGYKSARFVYASGGTIVGAVQVTKTPGTKYNVANIYVKPEFRRQGIATQLNNAAEKLCGPLDRLDSSPSPAALEFRKSLK